MEKRIEKLSVNYTFSEISKILDVKYHKIASIAKKFNIKSKYFLDIEKRNKRVIDLKNKGKNYIEIAKYLKISRGTVRNIYFKNNFELDGPGSGSESTKNKFINGNPFLDLTDDSVMYWLGFLAADGSIGKDDYSIRLGQSSKRKKVLFEYKNFLGAKDIKIFISKSKSKNILDTYIIVFSSKLIHSYLTNLGITNKKSKLLDLKFKINGSFLRGYFDGDGSAKYYNNTKSYKIKITTSSSNMIKNITEILKYNKIKYSITFKDKINNPEQRDINILSDGRISFYNLMYKTNYSFCVEAKRGVIEQSMTVNSVNCLGTPEEGNQQPS